MFRNPSSRFIGFDSFIGLPQNWGSNPAGTFSIGGELPTMGDTRISLVKGWFQNSTRDFFPALKYDTRKPTLVHFDADLYSSTLFLLTGLWWHLQEYYFIFDEFIGEELAAMMNFVYSYPVHVEFYTQTNNVNGDPIQVFGRLRSTLMVVDGIG
jgi:O-methyltransferase